MSLRRHGYAAIFLGMPAPMVRQAAASSSDSRLCLQSSVSLPPFLPPHPQVLLSFQTVTVNGSAVHANRTAVFRNHTAISSSTIAVCSFYPFFPGFGNPHLAVCSYGRMRMLRAGVAEGRGKDDIPS
jgi:hypothetical protein